MTVFSAKIEAGRIMHESSFGNDGSGTLGNYVYVPFREGTSKLTLQKPKESPAHTQQRVDGHETGITMPKSATWEFEVNLATFTTRADNTIAAVQSWLGIFLETYLGAKHLMTGTQVNDAGADANDWDALVATTLRPGAAVGLYRPSDGLWEVREIKSKTGSNIVLKHNTSFSPGNGDPVLGSATYYANPRTTGAEAKSIGAVLEGYTTTDKYVCRGGGVTACELILEKGQIPRFKFTVTFATWDYADGANAAANLQATILDEATYLHTNTMVLANSTLMVGTVGTAALTHSSLDTSAIAFSFAISHQKVPTVGGTMNVAQFARVHVSPLGQLKLTLAYEDQTWFDYRDNDTILSSMLQIGDNDNNEGMVAFSWPNLQVKDVQRVEVDGLSYQEVTLDPRHDTDTTAERGYEGLAQSAFRIHQL